MGVTSITMYTIRKEVLKCTPAEWGRIDYLFKESKDTIRLSPEHCKQLIGNPVGFADKFNAEETEFFNKLYPRKNK